MKIGLFLIVLFFNCSVFSQRYFSLGDDSKYIDSLSQIGSTSTSDSLRCIYSLSLSKLFLLENNTKKSIYYLNLGKKFAKQSTFLKVVANYYDLLPQLQKGNSLQFEDQLLIINSKLKKYSFPEAYKFRVEVLISHFRILQESGRQKESLDMLILEAIPIAKKSKDDEIICKVYKAIFVALLNANEPEKAEYYVKQAEFYIEKATTPSPTLLESKVETYIMHSENLTDLKKYKEAKIALEKADKMLVKYPKTKFKNKFFFSKGYYFSSLKAYETSIKYYDLGIENCKLTIDSFSVTRLKSGKYDALLKQQKYAEAIPIIENLIKTDQFKDNIKYHYQELSKAQKELGNFNDAYKNLEKYVNLSDSSNTEANKKEIVALEAKFKKTENEKRISQLLTQKEKAALVSKNDRLNMLLLGLLVSILLISIFVIWKYFKNQKRQKELDFKQEIEILENKKNLDITNALLEGEEVERKRLARDLHDGLGSMLSGLKLYYSGTEQSNKKEFHEVNKQLDNSITELRQIAQNLMPESLLKLGLIAALKDLCTRFSNDKTVIEFQDFGVQSNISESKQITIYRIIQELINNALKYANATEIIVNCSQNENIFLITVEDNGLGFDAKKADLFDGMGLKNIKNRVDFLKGELDIDSQPLTGTVFNIELNIFD